MNRKIRFILFVFVIMINFSYPARGQSVAIGSKIHPESRLLGEIIAQTLEQNTDLTVIRRFGLGGTLICFEALRTGEIDLYAEYSGTALTALLKESYTGQSSEEIFEQIADPLERKFSLIAGPSFGFSNTYVLITRKGIGLTAISDLQDRTDLRYGFSNEFVERTDGFSGLNEYYHLRLSAPRGMEHGLAYKALAQDQIDITDAYSTDGRLIEYGFQMLEDDQEFFPDYTAFPLIRKSAMDHYPEISEALLLLENQLTEEKMQELNHRYEIGKESPAAVAYDFLVGLNLASEGPGISAKYPVIRQTLEHIRLTFLATFLAILIAVPLAIYITHHERLAAGILSTTGVIQTLPSLALLGFLIPLFGIGFTPAVIALFLYALLPILRNTYTGLFSTDPLLVEAGRAMGMTPRQILLRLRLPLSVDMIMAGIRTALTINIGTATLAAFIGAGGLGEPIITGITLNDHKMILSGAIPAALLALIADQGMAWIEKSVGMRRRESVK